MKAMIGIQGLFECEECGTMILESELNLAYTQGNHITCSYKCFGKLIGVL